MVFDVELTDFLKNYRNSHDQELEDLSPMGRFMGESDAPLSSVNEYCSLSSNWNAEITSKVKTERIRSSKNNISLAKKNAGSDPLKRVKKGKTPCAANPRVEKKRQKKSQGVTAEHSGSVYSPSIAGSEARRSSRR